MKISTSLNATVEVSNEILELMDGFGWADGGEACCFSYDSALDHIREATDKYSETDKERERFLLKLVKELQNAKIYPDDVILIPV